MAAGCEMRKHACIMAVLNGKDTCMIIIAMTVYYNCRIALTVVVQLNTRGSNIVVSLSTDSTVTVRLSVQCSINQHVIVNISTQWLQPCFPI